MSHLKATVLRGVEKSAKKMRLLAKAIAWIGGKNSSLTDSKQAVIYPIAESCCCGATVSCALHALKRLDTEHVENFVELERDDFNKSQARRTNIIIALINDPAGRVKL